MKEYGRHIQRMVEHLLTLEDKEERQNNAYAVIELMGFLNPHLKNVEDFRHKLWDHLFLISDFKLDVESPYPIPTRETLKARPDRLVYPKRYPRYNHLGKNIEIVINKALNESDADKRQGFANAIAYYMKLVYSNWHKELMHDDTIQNELNTITKGQLEFNNRPFVKHRVDNRPERDEYRANNNRNSRGNYGARSNNNRDRDGGRNGGGNNRDNRNGGNNRDNRNNRGGGYGKKRY